MKAPIYPLTVVTVLIVTVLGCVSPETTNSPLPPNQRDELKARIDAAVKDRSNWVDPAREF
jgi:hypothetical protein